LEFIAAQNSDILKPDKPQMIPEEVIRRIEEDPGFNPNDFCISVRYDKVQDGTLGLKF
jgi:hypothetical protein